MPRTIVILLCNQDYQCAYCKKEITENEAVIDHFYPYVYVKHKSRFYASCIPCNKAKYTKIFDNLEEASEYIQTRRKNLPRMSKAVHAEEKTPEILHREVPMDQLEEIKPEREQIRKIDYMNLIKYRFNEVGIDGLINILMEEKLLRGTQNS